MKNSWQLRLPGFALAALLSLALSCGLAACERVAVYTQPTVVRVIDASYAAAAINVNIDGALFAANIGQGTFTNYGTLTAKSGALITVAPVAGGVPLISTNNSLLPGQQHSILITDNGLTPATYSITLLDDQRTAAAASHSAFRFINQGLKAGAVDIYMVPNGVTLANAVPVVAQLARGLRNRLCQFHLPDRQHDRHRRWRHNGQVHIACHRPQRRRSAYRAARRFAIDHEPPGYRLHRQRRKLDPVDAFLPHLTFAHTAARIVPRRLCVCSR